MDIKKLLASFNAHNVNYVVIGAMAFPVHGFDRSTQDIDIFFEPTQENAARVMQAMEAVGYDFQGLTIEQILQKKTLFRQYVLDTDIHPFVSGVSWERVWQNRVSSAWDGVPGNFASLNDLIQMKTAAGREKDLDDLRYLKKIRRIKNARKRRRKK